MRPKVAIAVLVFGVLVAVGALFLRQNPAAVATTPSVQIAEQAGGAAASTPATGPVKEAAVKPVQHTERLAASDDSTGMSPEEQHEMYVNEKIVELQDLGMDGDPQSLQSIMSEFENRDPEIRSAAVQAAVQFGSRDAIPALEDAAQQTDDAHERAGIEDAIALLKEPTLAEIAAGKAADSSTGH